MARVKDSEARRATGEAPYVLPDAPPSDLIGALQNLGFTPIEALAYCALLRRPGASGYRVAHAIGKSQGNTYTALTGLSRKGAVVGGGDSPRTYYAVPAETLFAALERRFTADCAEARRGLEQLAPAASGGAVVHFGEAEDALARARTMLARAESTAVYQLFPSTYAVMLRPLCDATRRLGQACAGVLFLAEPPHPGLNAQLSRRAGAVLAAYPDDHLSLAVDGRQFLLAIFDRLSGRLKDAVWTDDPLLAHHMQSAMVSDVILHRSSLLDEIGSPNMHLLGRLPASYRDVVNID